MLLQRCGYYCIRNPQLTGCRVLYSFLYLKRRVIASRQASSLTFRSKGKAEERLLTRTIQHESQRYSHTAPDLDTQQRKEIGRQLGASSRTSRVQQLLESSTRYESINKSRWSPIFRSTARRLADSVDADEVTKFFPPEVNLMYRNILSGYEESSWKIFAKVLSLGEKEGKPSASIFHWYLMIGLVARDSTVSIEDAMKMACFDDDYEKSPIYQSLENKSEMGGIKGQQRVLAFTLMHNLRKRMTPEALETVLFIWENMLNQKIYPSSRHVNALCASLIHLKRLDEALEILSEWMRPAPIDPIDYSREDPQGWISNWREGVPMNQFTVGIIMFALIQEGYPKRAYEMYKASISDTYRVSVHQVPLNLLLWAGRQPLQRIASFQGAELGEDFGRISDELSQDLQHWQDQTVWDGHPSALQARHIFLFNLFSRYPDLQNIINPLYQFRQEDDNGFMWKAHARMQRWSERFNNLAAPYVRWQRTGEDAALLHASSNHDEQRKRLQNQFQVDELSFNYYLQLLPYISIYEEVPWEDYVIVLAWMKHLNILPGKYSLLIICWAIDHLIPPVVGDFASCAGPLHDYLADWIGEENIPERSEMARFIKNQNIGA